MKLNSAKLNRLLINNIESLGFRFVPDTLTGSNGLYGKKLENSLFLTLGLTISRYEDNLFTGSYYLSKTTRWGSVWGDIPKESYKRIGNFLSQDERLLLLNEGYSQEGVIDAWWDIGNPSSIENFKRTLELTESRFLSQDNLLSSIECSKEIREMDELAKAVRNIIKDDIELESQFRFQPNREIDKIPLSWFQASEMAIKRSGGILNRNTVKLLASDVWRQSLILNG